MPLHRTAQSPARRRLLRVRLHLGVAAATALLASHLDAQTQTASFADLSIEELMNETVTSVSKKEQSLFDTPAAVAVLSNDDLRRSGATTIPDALRLVPGMDVGAVNSRESAVSARGFNGVFANKLLVLVDGRAVYTSLFGGVYWDLEQTMLEDVDRIEVIRGPGATVWGANAVNGVINVVTRSARDTQGTLLYAGGGNVHQEMAGGRYGGRLGENTYYRVFAGYQANDDTPLANGQSANDHWFGRQGGFRLDHYPDPDTHLTWQADATDTRATDSEGYNVNTLGRWTRRFSDRSGLEVQAYYDRLYRDEDNRSRPLSDTFDLSAHHTFGLGPRHDVIWGVGYRFIGNHIEQTTPLNPIQDGDFQRQLFNIFVQDEFKLVPDRLTLTAGLKVEHNDYTGFEFQPNLRLTFKPTKDQTLWAAISRAVRTPDSVDGRNTLGVVVGAPVVGPGAGLYAPEVVGNSALKSEVLWAYEMGYRIMPVKRVSIDLAVFYNDYSDLITFGETSTFVPGIPVGTLVIPWGNSLEGQTYGGEVAVTVSPTESWRLIAGYSLMFQQIYGPAAASRALAARPPAQQFTLRSAHDLTKRANLEVQFRYVDPIDGVPAYFTADIRLAYRLTDRLELSLVGQNLLDDRHPEQASAPITVTSEVPRGYYAKLTCRF
ncbi:MAG: TonB-dependent receptor [Verrucomicrobia bacterium]|nr:TonB-dependent receptor [Verrucomicrobiota bacterium]